MRSRQVAPAVTLMVALWFAGEVVAGQKHSALRRSTGPRPAPVLIVETEKGTIEIETFPGDAPETVAHVVALARRNFYNGQRVHRVEPGFVVQFGDPQTRDMTRQERWGNGGSGDPIGVAEIGRPHRAGSVGAAHAGDPSLADSQLYITMAPQPQLDADFTVWGRVVAGMDVVRALGVTDVIRRVSVKPIS